MIDYRCMMKEGAFYHVYNRGNAGTNLFYNKGNYEFFLHRYNEYLSPHVDTFAFCLLPNHFHLLVRVKERNVRGDTFSGKDVPHFETALPLQAKDLPVFENLAGLKTITTQAFSNFFNSYSKAINKQQNRHGSLFEKPFRRKHVTDTRYLANLVFYIHANPQLHGIADDFRMYPWSSYERMLRTVPSKLQKEEVLQWFSSADNYIAYHGQKIEIAMIQELMIE